MEAARGIQNCGESGSLGRSAGGAVCCKIEQRCDRERHVAGLSGYPSVRPCALGFGSGELALLAELASPEHDQKAAEEDAVRPPPRRMMLTATGA